MEIIFATGNQDKMVEIRQILQGLKLNGEDVEIYSLKEKGIKANIVEDGTTFLENAVIKAKEIAKLVPGALVMADDSGLEVDYINKEPGIYSARYMGEDTSYDIKNNNIIERLKDAEGEERSARYVCAIATVLPNGELISSVETMEGRIAKKQCGVNGFGFDPIFLVPPYEVTAAELTEEGKNAISHRGKALRATRKMLEEYYENSNK